MEVNGRRPFLVTYKDHDRAAVCVSVREMTEAEAKGLVKKPSDEVVFRDACDGYGLTEVSQTGDGLFCSGCLCNHKRPIKMYSNGSKSPSGGLEMLCKDQVIRLYSPNLDGPPYWV